VSQSNDNDKVVELSVIEMLYNDQYKVPIYQRNYAWREIEIEQLLQDLIDVHNSSQPYYLGSLIVDKRKDSCYEIIDGQQRHTTLCVLLAVLKNWDKSQNSLVNKIELNLGFDCRPTSEKTLQSLFKQGLVHSDHDMEPAILKAYNIASKFIKNPKIWNKEPDASTVEAFTTYLFNNVKILRVVVPERTDLNHYFEIMNSRGEQLEKHEILKARLMEQLEKNQQKGFARIWDACADMNRYVQLGFSAARRKSDHCERDAIFGNNLDECPTDFDDFLEKLFEPIDSFDGSVKADEEGNDVSLAHILETPAFRDLKASIGTDTKGKLGSVINFQNFLLHVLQVLKPDSEIQLDDKRLLSTFDQHKGTDKKFSSEFAKEFIMALLRMRLLFDRYIVKSDHELQDRWSLKTITRENTSTGINSFKDSNTHDRLIMLLSMFHVSYPAQTSKYWLCGALKYLYDNNRNKAISINGNEYLSYLEQLSDRFFYGRFGADSDDSPAAKIDYHKLVFESPDNEIRYLGNDVIDRGTHVDNFIFNRLDYLLWKRIKNNKTPTHGDDTSVPIEKLGKEFRFTFRSSVEHYYPQNPRDVTGTKLDNCDCFGNLCLISHHANSRYSDFLPNAKKQLRSSSKSNESLKQAFMMSYKDWGPGHENKIEEHQKVMVEVLLNRVN
jgi:hypothetical protein